MTADDEFRTTITDDATAGVITFSSEDFELFYQDLTSYNWSFADCNYSTDPLDIDNSPFLSCKLPVENDPGFNPGILGNCYLPYSGNASVHCGGANSSSEYKYCSAGTDCVSYELVQYPYHQTTNFTKHARAQGKVPQHSVAPSANTATTSQQTAPAIYSVRPESPLDSSIFIRYNVCARAYYYFSSSSDSLAATNITCLVFKGYRSEGVAAAFIDWAITTYGVNWSRTYATAADALGARAAARLEALGDVRLAVLAALFVLITSVLACAGAMAVFVIARQRGVLCVARAGAQEVGIKQDMGLVKLLEGLGPVVRVKVFAHVPGVQEETEGTATSTFGPSTPFPRALHAECSSGM
ncbi:hypothetical protein MPH_01824 [Macrophomina phaseolina MS6]|uniref:Uncharacterized protein n=1 Tax=Macrophomina phaseolina (strain MS6) TaxID=1126212 RepID=K2RE90_MACPH|nr:hypothetical protein MPH_01824 [Macrophomina phaseolina MS6]